MALTKRETDALVGQLELDLDAVCPFCLSVVAFAVEDGTPQKVAAALRLMTPDLWDDGLDEQALSAVRRLCETGTPHAREALAELEQRGPRSVVARAIVRRLAGELSVRTRRAMEAAMN